MKHFVLDREICRVAEWLARLIAVLEDPGSIHATAVTFIATVAAIYSLGHGLCSVHLYRSAYRLSLPPSVGQ